MKQFFHLIFSALIATCSVLAPGETQALAQNGKTCVLRDQKGTIAILVCPPGFRQEQWRRAGEAACRNIKPCSAWIWDDPKKAPQSTPSLASGIAKKDILTTVAIWDNDTRQLMMIRRMK